MSITKRNKANIYQDVLDILCQEGAKLGKASPTRVAFRANIPYVRFQKILEHLTEVNMIEFTDNGILITEHGLHCLYKLRKANFMLNQLGLNF